MKTNKKDSKHVGLPASLLRRAEEVLGQKGHTYEHRKTWGTIQSLGKWVNEKWLNIRAAEQPSLARKIAAILVEREQDPTFKWLTAKTWSSGDTIEPRPKFSIGRVDQVKLVGFVYRVIAEMSIHGIYASPMAATALLYQHALIDHIDRTEAKMLADKIEIPSVAPQPTDAEAALDLAASLEADLIEAKSKIEALTRENADLKGRLDAIAKAFQGAGGAVFTEITKVNLDDLRRGRLN